MRTSTAGTPARTWALRGAAVLFGLVLVGGAELAMRSTGRWADPPLPELPEGWEEGGRWARQDARNALQPTTVDGQPAVQVDAGLAGRMMAARTWTVVPAPGTTRVFAFGGSTTFGVPFEREPDRTFPGQVERLGPSLGRRFEVVNLGGAGFSTSEALDLATEVEEHGAAAWVLYAGNNEFFQFALKSYEANRDYPTPRSNLQRLHLFRALEDAIGEGPPLTVDVKGAAQQQRQVMARVISGMMAVPAGRPVEEDGRWRRNDPAWHAVVRRYRQNIERLEAMAAARGTRLYVVDTRPNLQQEPWLSLHGADVPGRVRVRSEDLVERSRAALAAGDPGSAADLAQQVVELDPVYALGWYHLGMARLAADDRAGAERALRNALDLDMDPGRPLTGLSDVVRELTADGDIRRIDLGPVWDDPRFGAFGGGLFHDSCHLTMQGYAEVGQQVAQALADDLPPTGPP